MRLVSIQVGKPQTVNAPDAGGSLLEKPWRTGYGKASVAGKVFLGETNLEGDGQANKRYHGGPEMAVLAYPSSHYPLWRAELTLPELPYGAFAENFTVEGVDESTACLGDIWGMRETELQIAQPRKPCRNISKYWNRADLLQRVIDSYRIGWYLRVLRTGDVEAGEEIRLLARPNPEWTVARAMQVRIDRFRARAEAAELAALPELGADWRGHLQPRSRPTG